MPVRWSRAFGRSASPAPEGIKNLLALPAANDLDRILRYEAAINRQLAFALNQLERLQRSRKSKETPPPINVQVTHGDELRWTLPQ